jgi:hypothetical protein
VLRRGQARSRTACSPRTPRSPPDAAIANSLLAALPRKDYQRLLSGLVPVDLGFGDVLYEPGKPIRDVYFPSQSLVSLLTVVEGHLALEVGLVGRDGMVGVPWRWASMPRRCARWCRAAGPPCG